MSGTTCDNKLLNYATLKLIWSWTLGYWRLKNTKSENLKKYSINVFSFLCCCDMAQLWKYSNANKETKDAFDQ